MKLLVLILLANLLWSCSTDGRRAGANSNSNVESGRSAIEPTPDDVPSDEQFARLQEDSFRPVVDKWLKGERLPEYVELDRKDSYAANSQRSARVRLLDVNGDGTSELTMQTACATVGNCVFILFQKTGDSFRELLVADMVQGFKLRKTRSNKYYDIETSSHGSSSTGGIAVYKYDGTIYKIAECFGYEYQSTSKIVNGQSVMRDEPTLTPAECPE